MGRIQVVAVLCLAACGRSGYERELPAEVGDEDENAGDGDGGEGEQAPELVVEPIVAGAATSWNSYMRYPGETLDFVYEPCVSPSLYRDCVHAGELRRVAVPGAASCSELGITASPAAFEWRCSDTPNGAVFTTKRLAPGIGLRDLIDFAARSFRPISVTVTQTGQAPRVSAETVWWDNTVRVVPAAGEDGRIVIDDPGVVYLVPQTLAAHGIDLRADGVALVGAPQARLTPASTPPVRTCQSLSVGTHVPSARACLLHADAVDRVWIEIDTDAAAFAGMALVLDNTELARVHRSRFAPVADHGMQLRGAIACRLTDVTIERGNNNVVFASSGNLFANLRVAGGDVYLFSSDENVFDALTTFGAFAGINLNGSSGRNAFVNSLSFSHGGHGVQLAGSNNFANVFVGTTLAATTLAGAGMWSSDRTTFHLSAIVNAGEHGIDLTSRAATVSHLLTGANNFAGVEIQNLAEWLRFAGVLSVISNGATTCDVGAATTGPALDEPSCTPTNLSDPQLAVRLLTQELSPAFVGYVADDPANTSDTAGTTGVPAAETVFDYAGASNRYRGWLANGAGLLLASGNRNCPGNSGTCWGAPGTAMRIVDWSLVANASPLFNTTLDQPNEPFVSGGPCPVGLTGNDFIADLRDGELLFDSVGDDDGLCEGTESCAGNKYLTAAIEIVDDYRGDDDGLCETDEHCVYAPNFGAYQGHGDYRLTQCTFTNGVISNVTMFAHPENGYPVVP